MAKYLFTSESVTEGHPDKVCDQISDAILDAILKFDKNAHVACETTATTGVINIMGEISANCDIDAEKIARQVTCDIGYDNDTCGFNGNTCKVNVLLDKQSADIAMGVNNSYELKDGEYDALNQLGAGDQGMMFGFACDETEELMPLPVSLAHKLSQRLAEVRKNGTLPYLYPDGKTQVSVLYEDGKPTMVDTVVVSTQHAEEATLETIRRDLVENVIRPIIPEKLMNENTKIYVNPTGRFVIGGPAGDSGLTGRKIIVDTYGGYSRHGGGAFSGKDPTKVDRSAAYYSRYIAKNIVASGLANKCEVQLAYAIGVAKPVSVFIDTFGTSKYSDEVISKAVNKVFDCRPSSIIRELDLLNTTYRPLASYGHMGREELSVKWEATDKVDALLEAVKSFAD
ncbi:MAG: methionine adenosyltransferase [Eubacteriales bacterium]|nr:methionine adenosyltransferase [Eubacteriales bacterium]